MNVFPFHSLDHTSNRRRFLGGGAGALGLAALGLSLHGQSGFAPVTASAQSGPWAGGDVPQTSRSSYQMAVAARAFLDGLSPDQLSSVWYPDLGDAARTQWSNLPTGAYPRPGVPIGNLSDSQR